MNSTLHPVRLRFRWARLDPDVPPGIHKPQHPGDCGWDLSALSDVLIPAHDVVDVAINCRIELPDGYWAEMKARSSIAKRGLQIDAGTIDNGYRGPLFVVCRNTKLPQPDEIEKARPHGIHIKAGERIAQLVFHKLEDLWDEEVDEIDIRGSSRGESAFGSTGRK